MKRVSENCDILRLENLLSQVDISENSEYTLLKISANAKYTNDDNMLSLIKSAEDRYKRYIINVNFEENWRVEKEIFEFLRLDLYKNRKIAFELMKFIDNMILDIIDN
jgi:hypothetical protein